MKLLNKFTFYCFYALIMQSVILGDTIMKKILIALVLIIAIGAAFYLLNKPQDKDELLEVKITQAGKEKFLLYLPLYVAMEEGYFEKNGVKVDLSFAGNDDQVVATVIGGDADVGIGDPVFSAVAQEKGGKVKTVALMITKLVLTGYTKNLDIQEISTAKGLNGLRISSWPAPSTMYTQLEKLKKDDNLDLTIVEGAFNAQLALLEAGKVDIALDLEPAASIVEEKGYKVVFDLSKFTDPQAITGLTVTEKFINEKPEVVQKVVDSMQQAHSVIAKDKEIGVRVAKKLFPNLSDKVIRTAINRIVDKGSYPKSVEVKDYYWQKTLQSRLDSGELKKHQATDVAVDNSFAVKAFDKYGK